MATVPAQCRSVGQQEGTGAYGDFPLHYNTCYALELNTESTVAEWDNQLVRFCAEETVAFTEDGKLCYLYPGQRKNLCNLTLILCTIRSIITESAI